ncbi:MAG: DUF2383 domain-containing protein [Phycisphaerales bacterium]|nr:DUF2383 domain-containing protein [Phycisphaerales bacterium]
MLCITTTPAVLRHLRSLIAGNLDSAQGLARAADCSRSPALARTLRACAVTREEFAVELRSVLKALGDADAVSVPTRAPRWWAELDDLAQRGGDRAVLNGVLRAESWIRNAYNAAVREGGADELVDVIQRQAESTRRVESHLRLLREVPRFLSE